MTAASSPQPEKEPEFPEREEEQQWAGRHHFPTRLLGWTIIGGVLLSFVGAAFGGPTNLFGGVICLMAGGAILRGSQPWLRFVTFLFVFWTLAGLGGLLLPLLRHEPFVVGEPPGRWVTWEDRDFWMGLVMPTGIGAALGTLGVACLRTRRLRFWTKTAKIWVGVFAGLVGVTSGVSALMAQRDPGRGADIAKRFSPEIAALRSYASTHGVTIAPASQPLIVTLMAKPAILSASLRTQPRGGLCFFRRDAPADAGKPRLHTEFFRLPSGEWAQLELEVLVAR